VFFILQFVALDFAPCRLKVPSWLACFWWCALGVAWCVNCQFGDKLGWSFGQAGWPVSGGVLWELHGA